MKISRNLPQNYIISDLINHLESSDSKAVDQELRDQFDVMLGSTTTVSSGTYEIEGISTDRVLFKFGGNYCWLAKSDRGTSFEFSDSDGATISSGSESGYDTTSFDDFTFYGTSDNSANTTHITLSTSQTVNTWLTTSNVGKFSKGYSEISTVTKEQTSRGGSDGPEYKLNLDGGTHFYIDYDFPTSYTDYNKIYITLENNLNLVDETSDNFLSVFLYITSSSATLSESTEPINLPDIKLETSYSENSAVSETIDVASFENFSLNNAKYSLLLGSSTYLIPLKINIVRLPFGGTSSFKVYTTLAN